MTLSYLDWFSFFFVGAAPSAGEMMDSSFANAGFSFASDFTSGLTVLNHRVLFQALLVFAIVDIHQWWGWLWHVVLFSLLFFSFLFVFSFDKLRYLFNLLLDPLRWNCNRIINTFNLHLVFFSAACNDALTEDPCRAPNTISNAVTMGAFSPRTLFNKALQTALLYWMYFIVSLSNVSYVNASRSSVRGRNGDYEKSPQPSSNCSCFLRKSIFW